MSLQHKEKSSLLFHFRSLFENFVKGNSYSHYKWMSPLFFLLCGTLILLLKRNRFCLLLIQSMLSLCTTLHTVQGGSYFSHSFHATSFQLEEWFYKVYVLKSAKIILNFSECNCHHYRYIVSNKTSLFSPAITHAKASLNIN